LRYDATASAAFPNFFLLDVGGEPVALDILHPDVDRTQRKAKEGAIASRPPGSWVWRTETSLSLPPFPIAISPMRSTAPVSHIIHGLEQARARDDCSGEIKSSPQMMNSSFPSHGRRFRTTVPGARYLIGAQHHPFAFTSLLGRLCTSLAAA
jgi:hypothetical protein